MITNNNAPKFDSILRRNLPSFLGITMGVLMLMAAAAPSAQATNLLTYYNFNDLNFISDPPGLQTTTITNNVTGGFPPGNLSIMPDKGTILSPFGGTVYQETVAGAALDARGNTTGGLPNPATPYCFTMGVINASSNININIGFAILSTGTGQFTDLQLLYSTNGTTFTSFATFSSLDTVASSYTTLDASLGAGADNQSTLYIEFCFTGASNNDTHNNTFIDNIQVTGVPEPSTYIGGFLGILGICWHQRRRLTRFLSLRPA